MGSRYCRAFHEDSGGFTHLFVAVDKFSKWIEANPVGKISAKKAVEFMTEIVTRFGAPHKIITDNDTQFTAEEFIEFASRVGFKIGYASTAHP